MPYSHFVFWLCHIDTATPAVSHCNRVASRCTVSISCSCAIFSFCFSIEMSPKRLNCTIDWICLWIMWSNTRSRKCPTWCWARICAKVNRKGKIKNQNSHILHELVYLQRNWWRLASKRIRRHPIWRQLYWRKFINCVNRTKTGSWCWIRGAQHHQTQLVGVSCKGVKLDGAALINFRFPSQYPDTC